MRLGRRHLSGACHGWRRRGHRLLSPCTLGGGRASLVCAAQVLSEKRTEHLLHRAGGRGAESRMQELGVVLGLVGLQMLEVRQRRLLEERVCVEQPRTALPTGTRMSPPDRAVLRAYARVAVSSVVLLAVILPLRAVNAESSKVTRLDMGHAGSEMGMGRRRRVWGQLPSSKSALKSARRKTSIPNWKFPDLEQDLAGEASSKRRQRRAGLGREPQCAFTNRMPSPRHR